MYYRYETHCHCSECSACSRSTAADLVRAYHAAGYAGGLTPLLDQDGKPVVSPVLNR